MATFLVAHSNDVRGSGIAQARIEATSRYTATRQFRALFPSRVLRFLVRV